jgi:hypothetical protein
MANFSELLQNEGEKKKKIIILQLVLQKDLAPYFIIPFGSFGNHSMYS